MVVPLCGFLAGFGEDLAAFHGPAGGAFGDAAADLGGVDAGVLDEGGGEAFEQFALLGFGAAGAVAAVDEVGGVPAVVVLVEDDVDEAAGGAGGAAVDVGEGLGDGGAAVVGDGVLGNGASVVGHCLSLSPAAVAAAWCLVGLSGVADGGDEVVGGAAGGFEPHVLDGVEQAFAEELFERLAGGASDERGAGGFAAAEAEAFGDVHESDGGVGRFGAEDFGGDAAEALREAVADVGSDLAFLHGAGEVDGGHRRVSVGAMLAERAHWAEVG